MPGGGFAGDQRSDSGGPAGPTHRLRPHKGTHAQAEAPQGAHSQSEKPQDPRREEVPQNPCRGVSHAGLTPTRSTHAET